MKTFVFFLFLSFSFIQFSTAQSSNNHEVGIRLNGLDDVDFMYKKHLKENKFLRLRFANIGLRYDNIENSSDRKLLSLGLAIGQERRKALNDKLSLVTGHEFQFNTSINSTGDATVTNLRLGLGIVFGFNYSINEHFDIGVETIPSLAYTSSFGTQNKVHSFDLGFSTSAANLLFMYKF